MKKRKLIWFRNDLRLLDNPALYYATKDKESEVLAVYILDKAPLISLGSASKWWLHNSLHKLSEQLGGKLNFFMGDPSEIIPELADKHEIGAVYWNQRPEPWLKDIDNKIQSHLMGADIECNTYNSFLIFDPASLVKSDGGAYKVFTPFYQKAISESKHNYTPLAAPQNIKLIKDSNAYVLNALGLLEGIGSLNYEWSTGEAEALSALEEFMDNGLLGYKEGRNFPIKANVSKLSPYLHHGEISPGYIWHKMSGVIDKERGEAAKVNDAVFFLREMVWREFAYYLLHHFSFLPKDNFQKKFDRFTWNYDKKLLEAWQQGKTGFPFVDAGMRELLQTGYMHNRMRMITASFLVRNLMIDWHEGEKWFWEHLVDADIGCNNMGWQWVAGTGVDASPYFRIFNPVMQGAKFDPTGEYTRKFVPELKDLSLKYLFNPWAAPDNILKASGVALGKNYPEPIVDLGMSRKRALAEYKALSTS